MSGHYLRHNERTSIPTAICVVDTETLPAECRERPGGELHCLRLGAAVFARWRRGRWSCESWIDFRQAEEFWAWLWQRQRPKNPVWLFAHGLGFDLTVLRFWRLLQEGRYRTLTQKWWNVLRRRRRLPAAARVDGFLVVDQRPALGRLFSERGTLRVVDTLNFWNCRVEELAPVAGVEKLPMPAFDALDSDWRTYCRRDVLVVYRAVQRLLDWWRDENLGHFRMTAASCGLQAFRHRFMAHKIVVQEEDAIRDFERAAIAAGETHCRYVGKIETPGMNGELYQTSQNAAGYELPAGPVWHLDVAGMYPSVMEGNLYPAELVAFKEEMTVAELKRWRKRFLILGEVEVNSPADLYPARAFGRRVWARGRFVTTLAGPELCRALEADQVERVYRAACYVGKELFTRYVDYFGELRDRTREGWNEPTDRFAKMLLNGLAGKFSQRDAHWQFTRDYLPQFPYGRLAWYVDGKPLEKKHRTIAGYVEREEGRGHAKFAVPSITAFVMSYARLKMAGYLETAGSGNWFYCDTDGLLVNADGYRRLLRRGQIGRGERGRLRVLGVHESVEIRGPKDYTLDGTHVVSGLSRRAVQTAPSEFEQAHFQGLAEVTSRPPLPGVLVTKRRRRIGRYHSLEPRRASGWCDPVCLPDHYSHLLKLAGERQADKPRGRNRPAGLLVP